MERIHCLRTNKQKCARHCAAIGPEERQAWSRHIGGVPENPLSGTLFFTCTEAPRSIKRPLNGISQWKGPLNSHLHSVAIMKNPDCIPSPVSVYIPVIYSTRVLSLRRDHMTPVDWPASTGFLSFRSSSLKFHYLFVRVSQINKKVGALTSDHWGLM